MLDKYSIVLLGLGIMCVSGASFAGCGLDGNPVAMDADGNAQLSKDEVKGTKLAWVFDKVDTDNNNVISQTEYSGRCQAIQTPLPENDPAPESEDTDPGVVEKKTSRQVERQKNNVDNRVNNEVDEAADEAVDGVLDSIFD